LPAEKERMVSSAQPIEVYLEVGSKRTIAGALEWPGWCRVGRDEAEALQALFDYGPRYAGAIKGARLAFKPPTDLAALAVVERLEGTSTSDFGVPDLAPAADQRPFDRAELERAQALLRSCWAAFDRAVDAADGKELRKGPRGGGRELDGIVRHVLGAEGSYLRSLGWKHKQLEEPDPRPELERTRQAVLDGLAAALRGELPERGPRGGKMWLPRYFVRRLNWHLLDHLWEIEDRVL
jgi:hypothetical protein